MTVVWAGPGLADLRLRHWKFPNLYLQYYVDATYNHSRNINDSMKLDKSIHNVVNLYCTSSVVTLAGCYSGALCYAAIKPALGHWLNLEGVRFESW